MAWSVSAWSSAIPFVQTNEVRVLTGPITLPGIAGGSVVVRFSGADANLGIFYDSGSTTRLDLRYPAGGSVVIGDSSGSRAAFISSTFRVAADGFLGFTNTGGVATGSLDTAFSRVSAGLMELNNGTAGTRRDLSLRTFQADGANNTIGATALTVIAGGLGFDTITAAASAPGAAGGKIEWRCGTNAGTIKIVAYGGTSSTGVTVVDNVGSGVTGC